MYRRLLLVVLHARGALLHKPLFAVREQKAFSPLRSHTSYHDYSIITIIQNVTRARTEDLLDVFCPSDTNSLQVSTHKS